MKLRLALAFALGGLFATASTPADEPRWPAPSAMARPAIVASRARVDATCETCHADVAEEWRASRHKAAFTNPEFQGALAREPGQAAFCRGCHAPEADPRDAPASAPADEHGPWGRGVTCVSCHLPAGSSAVLAGPASLEHSASSPHPLRREAAFTTERACLSCHEFAFPGRTDAMQRTVSEHAEGGDGASCADCHMKRVEDDEHPGRRHASHRFPGGHDAALVSGAVRVETRREPGRVIVRLTPTGVSHAVPTGDLFRRLAITVTTATGTETRNLARRLAVGGDGHELADDRLFVTPRELMFPLDEAADWQPVQTRVSLQRVAFHTGETPERAVVEGEIVIADTWDTADPTATRVRGPWEHAGP